jgi:DNA-binding YbaB/EbfC family protein
MFKEIGQFANLMRNLPKIREGVEQLQQRLSRITAEGSAGGDLVKARVNGKMELLSCHLSDDALKQNDRELLEDLIVGAVNQAMQRVRQLVAEETGKMAGELGMPEGMNFPGMS